jgi:hypothetical protein
LPSIIRIIKSRRMRCVGHVARRRDKKRAYRFNGGKDKERDHFEDQDMGGG